MADLKYYDIIQKPIITEKSMTAMEEKKYTQKQLRLRLKKLLRSFLREQRLLKSTQ